MSGDNVLDKTTRVNLLYDFYSPLLTEKQRTFLSCYFLDDLSLGEIAAEFTISRQAIYEHIKRAESTLEAYEEKLGLLVRHEQRTLYMKELKAAVEALDSPINSDVTAIKQQAMNWIERMERIED
ncbi:MAG: putative DNA-binding protein [Gorillibacterium sp.]|nr:putative DNA-binding protein [Gorillibacterium sp.]